MTDESRTRSHAQKPLLASIWAEDSRGVIGDGKDMLWRVPADLQHFRSETVGCPVIMGRASFESIGKPLPGRTNIVLSRDPDYRADGVLTATSLPQAVSDALHILEDSGAETIWITGGGQIFEQSMDLVDRLVVTTLDLTARSSGDKLVTAPSVDPEVWSEVPELSDTGWRDQSGDARWRVTVYDRR